MVVFGINVKRNFSKKTDRSWSWSHVTGLNVSSYQVVGFQLSCGNFLPLDFFFWKPAATQKSTFLFSELAKGRSRIFAIPIGCSSDVAWKRGKQCRVALHSRWLPVKRLSMEIAPGMPLVRCQTRWSSCQRAYKSHSNVDKNSLLAENYVMIKMTPT